MTPRPPSCDGPDCELSPTGWLHYPDCAAVTGAESLDVVDQVALEDGVRRGRAVASSEWGAAA